MIENNYEENIKKIIDPKSGFSLYLKKIEQSDISQVSPCKSFPTPPQIPPYTDELPQDISDIKSELKAIKSQSNDLISSNANVINALSKKNSTLTICVYLLGMAIIASIFF